MGKIFAGAFSGGFLRGSAALYASAGLALCLSSCYTSKPIQYFNGAVDTTMIQDYRIPDPLIERGDLLSVVIYSDNPEATMLYNQAGASGASIAKPSMEGAASKPDISSKEAASTAYLVDNRGYIRMHAIGDLKVEGLTRQQLEAVIVDRITTLGVLSNPYCLVRFSNFKVTVLGEVSKPGTFTMPSEKATILEVMSMAGEVNQNGRRDKIMLVRETMGKRTFAVLSLADPAIFTSPHYFLKQNDVLIVMSDERKQTPADQQTFQYITLGFSVISLLTVLVSSIIR